MEVQRDIEKITVDFNGGNKEVVTKGFLVNLGEGENENERTISVNMVNMKKRDLTDMVNAVLLFAEQFGILDQILEGSEG